MQRRKQKKNRAPARPLFSGTTALVKAGAPYRFVPGQSGNPGGRPSFAMLSSAYRARLADRIDARTAKALKLNEGTPIAEAIAAVVIRAALAGDIAAVREINNRCEGLPPAFLALATNAPAKTEVTFRIVTDEPKFPVKPELRKFLDDVRGIMLQEASDEIIEAAAKLARVLLQKYGTAKT